ncbi:MAG: hypothetical protein HQM00_06170 [Magnetococcales bacterium]|nr:hypothetical protein [Magnetococcales bacterium]
MAKEKRFFPMGCDAISGDLTVRIDQLYQRHATLVRRLDELERTTRDRLEAFSATIPAQLAELISRQQQLLNMAEEQEEESSRIFTNQNDLLNSLNDTLNDIHERLHQLSERQDALMRRVAVDDGSE